MVEEKMAVWTAIMMIMFLSTLLVKVEVEDTELPYKNVIIFAWIIFLSYIALSITIVMPE